MSSADDDGSGSIIRSMVIVCSVALVLFSFAYAVCWYRAKDRHRNFEAPNSNNNATNTTSNGEGDDEDNSVRSSEHTGLSTTAPPPPKPKFTDTTYDPSKGKKQREPGEPVYDKFIIGGTASLGVLMLIGATIVLIINLVEQANYNDAKLTDFVSLGQEACLIDSSARYRTYDKKLNALNRVCVEEWEYSVLVLELDDQGKGNNTTSTTTSTSSASFVTSPMSSDSCPDTCDECSSRLFGPDYYVGVDATKTGTPILDNNNNNRNNIFVECYAPTVPVNDLSGFYPCGTQREANQTCFLLRDIRQELQERKDSTQIGSISAYACYGGGVLLLLVVLYFKKRNQTVLQQDDELRMMTPESFAKDKDNANNNVDRDNDEEAAKETEETSEDEDDYAAGAPTKNLAVVVEEGRSDGVNPSSTNNDSDVNKEDGNSKA